MSELLEKARSYEAKKIAATDKESKPLFHISAPAGWINDPNGFSVYNGKIHLFYQYYPYLREWGPMHWGHSTTSDMIKWEQLPCVLAPDEEYDIKGCFSGSAIEADGKHVLVYTGVTRIKLPDGSEQERQNQCIAFGDGLNYVKHENNPVVTGDMLPENCSRIDFRDPKIWKEDDTYYLIVGSKDLNNVGQVVLCSSKNLTDWQFETILAANSTGKIGTMWECPDFFPLDGKQVLMLGPMEMLPKGEFHNGHNVIAFIGSYDKATHTFTKENVQLMDGGIDFYATQTTLAPDGRRIMTAWLQTWSDTEDKPKGCKWFGQTICPRELHIKDGRIVQTPVRELDAVHGKRTFHENVTVQGETSLEGIKGRVADLTVTVQPGEYRTFTLKLAADADHHTSLTYDPYTSQLTLDRSYAGSRADIVHRRSCKVRSQNGALKLRILLDKNSIEVFANDGEQTMTAWIYTPQSADGIAFAADGEATITAEQFELNL